MARTIPIRDRIVDRPLWTPGDSQWIIRETRPEGGFTVADAVAGALCGMRVIFSVRTELDGRPWFHVSFSYPDRLPTYDEMVRVKKIFIPNHTALQVFPPEEMHINHHPYCLHLWACLDGDVTPDFTQGLGMI